MDNPIDDSLNTNNDQNSDQETTGEEEEKEMSSGYEVAPKSVEERLEEKMIDIKLKEKEALCEARAIQIGLGYINLKGFPIGPEVLSLITENRAARLKIIPFFQSEDQIRIGAVNPEDPQVQKFVIEFAEKNKAQVEIYAISEHSFDQAFTLYAKIARPRKIVKGIEVKEEDLKRFSRELKSFKDLEAKIREVSLTEIFTLVLAGALQAESSDVHIEAEENDVKVRYRIDGVLHDVATLVKEDWPKIISRIKLLAGLKININDIPQDGRITIFLEKEKIDVRVSTLPTTYGESIVMRLLLPETIGLEFENLGIRAKAYEVLKKEISRPNGMIITTGPTGSGKTTTLYAFLKMLNKPEVKIITLEDPIEYKIKGINQSQVKRTEGGGSSELKSLLKGGSEYMISREYTFARGLRSILRQDPDIIMVGEIRDKETAEIAIQAALTGHLLLSTLHTNNAAGAIPRFLAMGAKPFLLAPALNAIIAQRLIRKICKYCKVKTRLDSETLEKVKKVLGEIPQTSGEKVDLNKMVFYRGKGCPKCSGFGYKGRIGVFEVLTMNSDLEKIILSGQTSEYQMLEIAQKHGMVTMVQDGLLKVLEGITTVEEVFRVAE